jgi:hypothetical protein
LCRHHRRLKPSWGGLEPLRRSHRQGCE